jgi:ribonuclease HI
MSSNILDFVNFLKDVKDIDVAEHYEEFSNKKEKIISIYIDGATPNNKMSKLKNITGGIGVYIEYPDGKTESISESVINSTNNKAELTALNVCMNKIKEIPKKKYNKIVIYSDSQYVIKSTTEWYKKWKVNSWKKADGKEVEHKELIKEITDKLESYKNISIKYIQAHVGIKGNEMADSLAKAGVFKEKDMFV